MSAMTRLTITTPGSVNDFNSVCNLAPGQIPALENFINYLGGVLGGNYAGNLAFRVGVVQATGTLTVASTGSTAAQACTIANKTLTGVASAPATDQFVVSTTPATQAANMAAAINASATWSGLVTASANGGVVTLTAVVGGLEGNGLQLSAGNLSNVNAGAFAGGSSGTGTTITIGASGA